MTTIESTSPLIGRAEAPFTLDEDQLAAIAFLARYRGRTLEAYRLFGRHNFLASMILPAFVSGIFHVRYRIFLASVAVAGILWVGGYVLVSYFLGPEAVDLIRSIGLKGILGLAVIIAIGLTIRWVWHRARLRRA